MGRFMYQNVQNQILRNFYNERKSYLRKTLLEKEKK